MGAVTSKSTIATGIACVLARIWRSELVPERTQRTPSSLGRFRRSSSTSSRGRTWLVLWGFTHARLATAVALGFILGWAAAHALFLHWWTLVPWGVAALALG